MDRVLHGRAGVHSRTRDRANQALPPNLRRNTNSEPRKPFIASLAHQTPQRFGFIIQAGQAFTESFLTAIEKQRNGDRALEIEGLGVSSDEAVVEAIKGRTDRVDGLAIVCNKTRRRLPTNWKTPAAGGETRHGSCFGP